MDAHTPDQAIDIIGIRRGFVCGVVGVADWDLSRMRETTEIVLYRFADRDAAYLACRDLKKAQDMRLAHIDGHFAPGCTIVLGEGKPPSSVAPPPTKIRVIAPAGFAQDPLRVMDRCIDIIERGAWDEHPGHRAERPREQADEEARVRRGTGADGGREATKKLGCAPPMSFADGRGYTEPQFNVPVEGFYRRINPTSIGTDEHGNPMQGRTYVNPYKRFADKPDRPGVVENAMAGP